MDDEKIRLVNIGKVAKRILSIGQFGLFQVEGVNLIATQWFILNVNDEQFWRIQCKLEAKKINVWLFKSKDGLNECQGMSPEATYHLYSDLVRKQNELLKRTYLTFQGIELFTNNLEYIGILSRHLEMIDYAPTIKKPVGRESIIVDEIHVFTPVRKEHTSSRYLRTLKLMEREEGNENHIDH